MYTDEWRRLNGVWLHYQDWSTESASRTETVLLLHGLTQQSHAFDAVAARLSSRHRCVALDLRGRGESDWAPGT
jgi:pimeloyl-ACP methyl ester carboxylesterase